MKRIWQWLTSSKTAENQVANAEVKKQTTDTRVQDDSQTMKFMAVKPTADEGIRGDEINVGEPKPIKDEETPDAIIEKNKLVYSDDLNDNQPTQTLSSDILAVFQADLRKKRTELEGDLEKWLKIKAETYGEKFDKTRLNDPTFYSELCAVSKFDQLFKPAETVLSEMLEKVRDYVNQLIAQTIELDKQLNDKDKSHEEKHKISIDICNANIVIANELMMFGQNVLNEINNCLSSVKMLSNLLVTGIPLAVEIATGISLPPLTFLDLNKPYRSCLTNRLLKPKEDEEIFFTDTDAIVHREMKDVIDAANDNESNASPSKRDETVTPASSPQPSRLIQDLNFFSNTQSNPNNAPLLKQKSFSYP